MTPLALDRTLPVQWIDEVFEHNGQRQYPRKRLFSSVAELMSLVTLNLHRSLHAAARKMADRLPVSLAAPCYESMVMLVPLRAVCLVLMATRSSCRSACCNWPDLAQNPTREFPVESPETEATFAPAFASAPASAAPRAPSLRGRLIGLLLLAVFIVACVQAGITYRTARASAAAVFDAQMQRVALSLSGALAVSAPGDASGSEDFIIQVWRADGVMLYRSPTARLLPPQAVLGFSAVQAGGRAYRVYTLQTPLQVVQIAQAVADRQRLAGWLALRAVLPVALLAPMLMLIVWGVVTRALAPVERVRRQTAARRADDLAPLPVEGLPAELRPLVEEMNALLARVAAAWTLLANFSGDAAHELRTPLTALRLQTQSLQRAESPQARQTAADRLLAGIDRATRLVEQLLALARQEGRGASGETFAAVNMAQLAQRAVADAQAQAGYACITLHGPPPDAAAQARGDAEALAMLLRNLIENALRYTPSGGQVRVMTGAAQNMAQGSKKVMEPGWARHVWLTVEDSGPGIAPEERTRVLDRFYRAPNAMAQGGVPGSGLGLAIVRAVVIRHGGDLRLDDSPDLGGLRVRVCLPAAD